MMEQERQRREQDCIEMIEEFDKTIGDAFIENLGDILDVEDARIRDWEQRERRRWDNNRTDTEKNGDDREREEAGKEGEQQWTQEEIEIETTIAEWDEDLGRTGRIGLWAMTNRSNSWKRRGRKGGRD